MRIEINDSANVIEAIKAACEGEVDFNLNDPENTFTLNTCGLTADLNKEELYLFIEELSEIADRMTE